MIRYYNGDYGFPAGNAAAVGGTGQLAKNIPVAAYLIRYEFCWLLYF